MWKEQNPTMIVFEVDGKAIRNHAFWWTVIIFSKIFWQIPNHSAVYFWLMVEKSIFQSFIIWIYNSVAALKKIVNRIALLFFFAILCNFLIL